MKDIGELLAGLEEAVESGVLEGWELHRRTGDGRPEWIEDPGLVYVVLHGHGGVGNAAEMLDDLEGQYRV